MNGGYNIVDDVKIKQGDKFDRFGNYFINKETGEKVLGGTFTSPMQKNGEPYLFESRALKGSISDYEVHYQIEILTDNFPYTGQLADVIPWHGHVGGGKQMNFNLGVNPKTRVTYTWTELEKEGLIKITILQ